MNRLIAEGIGYDDGYEEGARAGLDMVQRWIESEFKQGRRVLSLPKDTLLDAILVSKEADRE